MTSSKRPGPNSNHPQDEVEKGESSVSGQHRLDLNKTLGSEAAAKAIADGRRLSTLAGVPSSTVARTRKRLQEIEEAQKANEMAKDDSEPPRNSQTDLEGAGEDAKKGMDTFTHYADTITDSLFLIIGKFSSAVTRINLAIVMLVLVCAGVGVLIYRFEGGLDAQAEERKKTEQLRAELKTLKEGLIALRTNATDTRKAVEAVKEAAEDKPDIDIVTDSRTGQEKLVIVRKESRIYDGPIDPDPMMASASELPPPPPPVAAPPPAVAAAPRPAPRPAPSPAAKKKSMSPRKRVEIPLPRGMVEQLAE